MSRANPPRVPVTFEARTLTVEPADDLGIDIQAVCGTALRDEAARQSKEQNRDASASMNRWIEERGLPLGNDRV